MNKSITILSIALLCSKCISPVELDLTDDRNALVISGFITNQSGPYTVTISQSVGYDEGFTPPLDRVSMARITVRDDIGRTFDFQEVNDGIYESDEDFIGEIGRTYSLLIELSTGERYLSFPEQMLEPPIIDTLFARYKELPSTSDQSFTSGVEVFASFRDRAESEDYYFFGVNGTYRILTFPERYIMPGDPPVEAPKDCCNSCFISESSIFPFSVASDRMFDGNEITLPVTLFVDDGRRFTDKYYADVQLYRTGKESFLFYQRIATQLEIDGDIFDPPPAGIRGNIRNIDNPSEKVLGYFGAYGVSSRAVFLEKEVLERPKPLIETYDDCRLLRNSSIEIPEFWVF